MLLSLTTLEDLVESYLYTILLYSIKIPVSYLIMRTNGGELVKMAK